jgi:UDP-glucose 4-epimerase
VPRLTAPVGCTATANSFDMVWVRDGALALVLALEAAAAGNVVSGVMECGPEEHTAVLEVAELVIMATAGLTGNISEITHLPMRPGETPGAHVTCDPATLAPIGMKATDLKPLADGVEETVAWYAEHWLPGWRP